MFDDLPMTLALQNGEEGKPLGSQTGNEADGGDGATGTQENGGQGGGNTQNQAPAEPFNPMFMMMLVVGMIVLMMVFSSRSQRKEKKRREELLAGIKKGDKVVTRGGVLGTVIEVRDRDVTLKVDENANTRIQFDRNAIELIRTDSSD